MKQNSNGIKMAYSILIVVSLLSLSQFSIQLKTQLLPSSFFLASLENNLNQQQNLDEKLALRSPPFFLTHVHDTMNDVEMKSILGSNANYVEKIIVIGLLNTSFMDNCFVVKTSMKSLLDLDNICQVQVVVTLVGYDLMNPEAYSVNAQLSKIRKSSSNQSPHVLSTVRRNLTESLVFDSMFLSVTFKEFEIPLNALSKSGSLQLSICLERIGSGERMSADQWQDHFDTTTFGISRVLLIGYSYKSDFNCSQCTSQVPTRHTYIIDDRVIERFGYCSTMFAKTIDIKSLDNRILWPGHLNMKFCNGSCSNLVSNRKVYSSRHGVLKSFLLNSSGWTENTPGPSCTPDQFKNFFIYSVRGADYLIENYNDLVPKNCVCT